MNRDTRSPTVTATSTEQYAEDWFLKTWEEYETEIILAIAIEILIIVALFIYYRRSKKPAAGEEEVGKDTEKGETGETGETACDKDSEVGSVTKEIRRQSTVTSIGEATSIIDSSMGDSSDSAGVALGHEEKKRKRRQSIAVTEEPRVTNSRRSTTDSPRPHPDYDSHKPSRQSTTESHKPSRHSTTESHKPSRQSTTESQHASYDSHKPSARPQSASRPSLANAQRTPSGPPRPVVAAEKRASSRDSGQGEPPLSSLHSFASTRQNSIQQQFKLNLAGSRLLSSAVEKSSHKPPHSPAQPTILKKPPTPPPDRDPRMVSDTTLSQIAESESDATYADSDDNSDVDSLQSFGSHMSE